MATQKDVRRIAMALPGVSEGKDHFAFSVENKGKARGFCWVWRERSAPKRPRVPRPDVLAVRVANEAEKAALLTGDPGTFFTEPHYNGFPAVLVRLPEVGAAKLGKLLADAWRCVAPSHLLHADTDDKPTRRPRKPNPSRRAARTP